MDKLRQYFKYISFTMTALITGMLLFTALAAFNVNHSLLSSEFHKQLFIKHDLYSRSQAVINSSMEGFVENFKNSSPQSYAQYKDTFAMLEQAFTPEMVKTNLDTLREGIFQYLKGERTFLPDIYLGTQSNANKTTGADSSSTDNLASQALTKINKINLSVILSYIDRNDIVESIHTLKFFTYIIGVVPVFSVLSLLVITVLCIFLLGDKRKVTRWIALAFFTCSILALASGAGLLVYTNTAMPWNISPVVMSIPLPKDVIISYLKDCTSYISVFLSVIGLLFLSLGLLSFYFHKRFLPHGGMGKRNPVPENLQSVSPDFFAEKGDEAASAAAEFCKAVNKRNLSRMLRYISFIVVLVAVLSLLGYQLVSFKKGFESNDFATVLAKLKNSNTVTQVISAKDDAVYTLQVKLVEHKTDNPVSGTRINVNGKSDILNKDFNETAVTDEAGTVKFNLDKGTFRLSFSSASFPIQYQMPSPVFFDLKKAGTTIITVNLDNLPEIDNPQWGIAEVEVLDENNKPVPDLELTVDGTVSAPGYPDRIFSRTNADGIAVFKINQGNYKINFVQDKFPKQYILPSPLDISVTYNAITRYTVRLAAVKETSKKAVQKKAAR